MTVAPAPAPAGRPAVPLALLGQQARPVTLAAERALPVVDALAPLLPDGTLPRGVSVGVSGPGATSLALGLVAAASAAGSWTVVVGAPDLGLVAASEAGLDLARTVVVAPPPPERWPTVVAALVEAVELVLVRPSGRVRPTDVRRLGTHLRSRGGVLVRLPGPGSWPEDPDISLRASVPGWRGAVGPDRLDGAGRLRARRLVVEATGRRRAARPRRLELWLPGPDGRPAPVAASARTAAGPQGAGSPGSGDQGAGVAPGPPPGWARAG
ncbi:hypothetical protein PO878_06285 [Iamia majanohamensis]|uniref:Uncharacterized protein n=1 Tax=Iamia majanohamensis TaxID=467976 RepID=A0AAF0BWX5_9ACTN|nr:hypothetical protein [Iamia majanohamensis]WCO68335.1 hypothetical protein PO878_06285 [Iamia majanohamensis]